MCRDLEEVASKWKPSWRGKKQVKNLTQEGDLLKKQMKILPAKNHSKLKVNSNRVDK